MSTFQGAPPPTIDGVSASKVWLPAGDWPSVFSFLVEKFAHVSADEWATRFNNHLLLSAAGNILHIDTPYSANQAIYYYRALPVETPIPFKEHIVFEDELLVVADKPHFLPVTPVGAYVKETLLVRLKNTLACPHLAPVHRLDKNTAGLVLFTKQPQHRAAYAALFSQHRIDKHYEAIARSNPALQLPLTYQSHITRGNPFYCMREDSSPAASANSQTTIACVEALTVNGEPYARYLLTPHTGKQHQLRLHMASLGMPILNDMFYPKVEMTENNNYEKPLQLLAKQLTFTDPISGALRAFNSTRQLLY